MENKHGLKINQEVTWRCESRGGYGYIQMAKAIVLKLNQKTVRIKCWSVHKIDGKSFEREHVKNVKYENIKQSDLYTLLILK